MSAEIIPPPDVLQIERPQHEGEVHPFVVCWYPLDGQEARVEGVFIPIGGHFEWGARLITRDDAGEHIEIIKTPIEFDDGTVVNPNRSEFDEEEGRGI